MDISEGNEARDRATPDAAAALASFKKRERATPADPAAWQTLRDTLRQHTAGMPAAWRDRLLDEATDLLDASRRHQDSLRPSGMLTRRGFVRVAYKDYLALQDRLERVFELLGFGPVKPTGKPGLPDRVTRTLSPAARERLNS